MRADKLLKEAAMPDIQTLRVELKRDGYAIIQYDDDNLHSYPYDAPWLTDEAFNKVYNSVREHTLVDRTRCYSHYLLMDQIKKIPGDILEVGAWRGGTAGIFAQLMPDRMVYVADTFEGVVKSSAWEHYEDRAHADTSEDLVTQFLGDELNVSNFTILKGIFPEDTGSEVKEKQFSFVHIDVDVYRSARDSFEFVWDNVSRGGVVAFDDYGFISACSGVHKFVNEIKDDADKLFIQNLNGHAYIMKLL